MDSLYRLFIKKDITKNRRIKFNVVLIIFLITVVLNIYFKYNYTSIIVLLVFALWIANYYVTYENENVDDFNKSTMARLGSIQKKVDDYVIYRARLLMKTGSKDFDYQRMYERSKLSSLYMDANMINFLYSVKQLSEWNNELYYKLVIGTNKILNILEEIEAVHEKGGEYPENIAEMLEIVMELRLKMINTMHDFVYMMPKGNRTNRYLSDICERYRGLITRDTDKIYKYYKDAMKSRGINNMTKFINYFDSPRAVDQTDLGRFY